MSRKVLLIRFSSLGDVVLTSALLKPLAEHSFEIHLLTYKPYDELFAEDRRVTVLGVDREYLKNNFRSLIKRLNAEGYDAILDLHSNLKSFLIRKTVSAEVKKAYNKRSLYRRVCIFLNRLGLARRLKENTFNVVSAYADTLKVLGIETEKPRPFIEVDPSSVVNTLKKYNLQEGSYVVLGVGARYKKKAYPHFKELAKLLNSKGIKVVLIGDRKDYEKTKHFEEVLNLCGKLSLLESLHILKGAKFYIGNDSGASHMARAVKTPVAFIYGGTHPCLGFAPFPDEGIVITKNLSCSPCDLHGKGNCKRNLECLDIPPEKILSLISLG